MNHIAIGFIKEAISTERKKQIRAGVAGTAVDIPASAAGAWVGSKYLRKLPAAGRMFEKRPGLAAFVGGLASVPLATGMEIHELNKKR